MYSQAYTDGIADHDTGISRKDNPYLDETNAELASAWYRGWDYANRHSMKSRRVHVQWPEFND